MWYLCALYLCLKVKSSFLFSASERTQPNISESVMGPFSSMSDVGPTRRYRSSASSTRLSPGASICFKCSLFPSIMPAKSCNLPYDVHSIGRFNPQVYYFEFQVCFVKLICVELKMKHVFGPFMILMQRANEKSVLSFSKRPRPQAGELGNWIQLSQNMDRYGEASSVAKRLLERTKSQTNILIQGLREEVLSEQNLWKQLFTHYKTLKASEMVWVFFSICEHSKFPAWRISNLSCPLKLVQICCNRRCKKKLFDKHTMPER